MKQYLIHDRFAAQPVTLIFTTAAQGARSILPHAATVPMLRSEAETFQDMEARGVKHSTDVQKQFEIREAEDIRHSIAHHPGNPCGPGCTGYLPPEGNPPGWVAVDTAPGDSMTVASLGAGFDVLSDPADIQSLLDYVGTSEEKLGTGCLFVRASENGMMDLFHCPCPGRLPFPTAPVSRLL